MNDSRESAMDANDALLTLTIGTQDKAVLRAVTDIALGLRDQGAELDRLRRVERAARAVANAPRLEGAGPATLAALDHLDWILDGMETDR